MTETHKHFEHPNKRVNLCSIAYTTMQKLLSLLLFTCLLGVSSNTFSQAVFWSDTFDAPAGGANNNNAAAGWELNTDGFGGNQFYINNSNTNCQGAAMLHISCEGGFCTIPFLGLNGPFDAIYNASTDASQRSAISPSISTIGQSNIELRFFWVSNGEPGADFGSLSLSADDGATWQDNIAIFEGTDFCQEAVFPLGPEYNNVAGFRIKFNWVNDANNVGSDFALCVDDIRLIGNNNPAPTISITSIPAGPFCPNTPIDIDFIVSENFGGANMFTAQMSDATGSFASPVEIGTFNGSVSGTINAIIPPGTPVGANYLIRIISSDPGSISAAFEIPIEIADGPTASIDNSSGTTACPGSGTTLLYSGSEGNLQWSSSTDGINFSPVAGEINVVFNTPPINEVTFYQVTITNDCGTSTSEPWEVEITDEVEIPLLLTPNTTNLCNGPVTVSVTGTFVGLEWSDGQTGNSILVDTPGSISVIGQDPTGCPAASEEIDFIETEPPPLTTIPISPVTLCGANATITASAGFAEYQWSNGQAGNVAVVNAPGIITVTGTDNEGCVVTSSPIDIIIGTSVIIPVEPSVAAICDGIPAVITAGEGFTNYTWSNGATGQEIMVSSTGFYSVTADDNNGCPGSSPLVEVIESQFPIPDFSYVQNDGGYTINFNNLSQNAVDVEWTFDSIGTSPLFEPSFTFPDFGPYTISLIIENPCGRDTIEKLIVVTPVGINDLNYSNSFLISPNPSKDFLFIRSRFDHTESGLIRIHDLTGRTILTQNVQLQKDFNLKLDISSLTNGTYIIDIVTNKKIVSNRFVKN